MLQVAAKTGGVRVGSIIQQQNSQDPKQTSHQKRDPKSERQGRQPMRKDRLKEYRSFSNVIDKAKLLRSTARNIDRYDDVEILVEEAVANGEFPKLLASRPEEGLARTALHMAAWRGDVRSIQLLLKTAAEHCPELDVVNLISRSEGNYGKTPIFYALTQCREDVVRLLVENDASLLVVNNKGQTPCSIAVSHLNETACQHLFEIEAQQLRNGGTFVDYRKTHSDKKFYGDLDPRFPVDNFNYGEDLSKPLEDFKQSVNLANPSTIVNGVPTEFSPRSIRPTVRWWNREGGSLESANDVDGGAAVTGQITFTQPRPVSKKKSKNQVEPTQGQSTPSSEYDEYPEKLDIQKFDLLTMDFVMENGNDAGSTLIVNCSHTIGQLNEEIERTLESVANPDKDSETCDDSTLVRSAWGLDCEWEPGFDRGKNHPVATLQLSTREKSFLIDVQSLCQQSHDLELSNITPTAIEVELNKTLSSLFSQKNLIIGFGILQDLGKLAASFPHLSCFSNYVSVIDLQAVTSLVYPKNMRPHFSSLQKAVAVLLSKRMDKSQQCSSWTTRPLNSLQIEYATLDAAVLPLLLETIVNTSEVVERYNGQFFTVHANLQSNLRYVFVDDDATRSGDASGEELVWHVPMGTVRKTLGRPVARQCWPSIQATPCLPQLVQAKPKGLSKRERAHVAKVGDFGSTNPKPKPVQLKTLSGNLNNLPIPGITLGYTKDSCAERVVGHTFLNTLPEGTHIGFNRRSGVVETTNCFLVFCNFGAGATVAKQQLHHLGRHRGSEFSGGGRFLTFHLNPKRQNGSERELAKQIINSEHSTESSLDGCNRDLLLFARGGTSSKFLYCGHCRVSQFRVSNDGESLDMELELLDFEALTGESRISDTFVELVKSREEVLNYAL
uniref:3'-5' exonuclease domain-containing protein n=1 Tax=Entomoneis paludosa TaxID=265537 RepID=A0A7S3DTI3_9STRA